MTTTYEYSMTGNGDLICTRTQPANEQTRGLLIYDQDDGYGASGITQDWVLPANAVGGFGFFELYRRGTETYHQILVPEILSAIDSDQHVEDPPHLDVRHRAWPGMDKREIELEILACRQGATEDALRLGREKKAREELERLRLGQEERWRAEVEAAIEREYGPLEAQITKALEAEFGPGFRL